MIGARTIFAIIALVAIIALADATNHPDDRRLVLPSLLRVRRAVSETPKTVAVKDTTETTTKPSSTIEHKVLGRLSVSHDEDSTTTGNSLPPKRN